MQTLKILQEAIFSQVFADHQPDNLVPSHKQIILEGLAEIQKWVPCEQQRQANVILFCNTFVKCGLTVVPRPRGIIQRVYTVANEDWCDPVFMRQGTLAEVECYQYDCRTFTEPDNEGMPRLPLGFKRAEASGDSEFGRARSGMFAIQDDNVYISPRIQSNERVVIEWAGIKLASDWTEYDPVSDALDFRKALKLFLQYGHERDYGDLQTSLAYHNHQKTGTFDEALADLMWQCREETRIRKDEVCRRIPTYAEVEDDVVPT